ncbi:lysophosphatidic acid receptor 6-like [Puntigrus tetrazona]|uniref:lysophosphatidic acid receptor 6-like n=1 Tax=Puntigrus tetrazona TaxID=1606681 RepID=UPI001C899BB2|nr:lysophosphatidic acid receptor 6-like [Puntigrus tetrazona]XP_043085166.1 lysophosphatidic acid receptor 6-like [Puntigrus tetrazona]XP_043085167.1 lysophosphatidic acid receptor 6-like [Puntigrus tetrazona]XP_043085169.1 lysophosphatidic acid receptor 6-like [Puntigrus tetrazona]
MAQLNISINDSAASDEDLLFRKWMELENILFQECYPELVYIRVLSVIEISAMILTLIALCFIIKSRPAASVFVSNLILSDLVQVISILIAATISWKGMLLAAYNYSLMVGLYFMTCVAFERYLLICHPIWYKSHQSLKLSCFISVIIWFVPLTCAEIYPYIYLRPLPMLIACLIPYPIIILCFAGTCRGLSHAISLTAQKRKSILGILFLVLLTYTFLVLPYVFMLFIENYSLYYYGNYFFVEKMYRYARMIVCLNPLADCFLYMFIRPDVGNLLKKSVCCCRRRQSWKRNQDEHSVVNPQNSCPSVVCCISAQKPSSHSLNTGSSV